LEDLAKGLDAKEQIDCLVLDFSKAFDSVPHQRLLYKLDWYGVRGTTLTWLQNWLTSRTQTVVIDGEESEVAQVISGVPQGTVLGPLLFLLYVNDIGENTSCTTRLFADDALVYRKIQSKDDTNSLQTDLNTMVDWSHRWQMSFNPKKCSLLRVTKKQKIIQHTYSMMGTELNQSDHHPYLGVELSSGLEWKHHIELITGKAKKTLHFLQRNLYNCPPEVRKQAYISLVRPTLEYAASCWDPYLQKDIKALEAVQRKAARFISNNFRRRTSVTALMTNLELPPLQHRREASRLSMLYKIHHNEVKIQIPDHFRESISQDISTVKTRSHHEERYHLITPRIDTYKNSFYPRTIQLWNTLPLTTIHAPTVKRFNTLVQQAVTRHQTELYMGSVSAVAGAPLN
jgi:hypothetical protein